MTEKTNFEKGKKLILQMAELKNKLKELGIIRSKRKITADYAEWFCIKKFDLKLRNKEECGYDAQSKYGDKVLIKSKIGSDIDFMITFDGIVIGEFDYLLVVFINEETWMIDSIYRVSNDVVKQFTSTDTTRRFRWERESRSLSLQEYPDEENTISL